MLEVVVVNEDGDMVAAIEFPAAPHCGDVLLVGKSLCEVVRRRWRYNESMRLEIIVSEIGD